MLQRRNDTNLNPAVVRCRGESGFWVSRRVAMKALKIVLAGGVAAAALAAAAPAAAQYYPGYPSYPGYPGYGYGGNPVGNVINQVFGGGYGYGANNQVAVSQCVNAVQARLAGGGGYGYSPYGYNNAYGRGRVLGISRVEQRSNGGLTVRGVATTGMAGGYGYTPNSPIDLTFRCKTDYRGLITDIDIDRAQRNYGSNYTPYDPYAAYGYRRY
jgi:hypothetical protein